MCEPCRTTLPAFHTNKQRLVDLNDRVEHDVVLLSATERLRLWKQISLRLPYMAIFHHVYFKSQLNNLWHWLHCLTSSIHNQNRISLECQELVTIRRQETRVLTRREVLVGHKTRYYWQTWGKQAGKDTLSITFHYQLMHLLTLRLLMSYIYIYIYGAPILDVSRSHTTTQHSR